MEVLDKYSILLDNKGYVYIKYHNETYQLDINDKYEPIFIKLDNEDVPTETIIQKNRDVLYLKLKEKNIDLDEITSEYYKERPYLIFNDYLNDTDNNIDEYNDINEEESSFDINIQYPSIQIYSSKESCTSLYDFYFIDANSSSTMCSSFSNAFDSIFICLLHTDGKLIIKMCDYGLKTYNIIDLLLFIPS